MSSSCTKCGGTEYDCSDGLYYCTICNTQSQDIREEEAQFDVGYQQGTACIDIPSKSASQARRRKKMLDPGRPWKTYEGQQVILKEIAKSVIRLGAKQELLDVVFRLWILYLGKCGTAFVHSECAQQAKVVAQTIKQLNRDKYPGTLDDPRVKPVYKLSTWKQRYPERISRKMQERKKLQETLAAEKFYEGDDLMADDAEEQELMLMIDAEIDCRKKNEVLKNDDVIYDEQGRSHIKETGRPVGGSKTVDAQPLKLLKLLALVYIGLQYTNNLVQPADITSWIKSGQIPLLTVVNFLPENMHFFGTDFASFRTETVPTATLILKIAGRLMSFLQLDNVPPVDILLLTSRYIVEMNLPGQMHRLVINFIESQPPLVRYDRSRNYPPADCAVLSMAYIIIILKSLFGLDDSMEKRLSEVARLESVQKRFESPLFVWEEWVGWTEQHVAFKAGNSFPSHNFSRNVKHIRDVSKVVSNFETVYDYQQRRTEKSASHGPRRLEQMNRVHGEMKNLCNQQKWHSHSSRALDAAQFVDFSCCCLKYITETAATVQDVGGNRLASSDYPESDEDMFSSSQPSAGQIESPGCEYNVSRDDCVATPLAATSYRVYCEDIQAAPVAYQWIVSHCARHVDSTPECLHHTIRCLELHYFVPSAACNQTEKRLLVQLRRRYFPQEVRASRSLNNSLNLQLGVGAVDP